MFLFDINSPLDHVKYVAALRALEREYRFLKTRVIGKSVLGKDIIALKIGEGYESVLFAAAFHGSEHITANIALRFCEELCLCLRTEGSMCDIDITRALAGRSVVIIPRVNPDGCDISILGAQGAGVAYPFVRKLCRGDLTRYNANARGVDINHNFDAGWRQLRALEKSSGITGPAPRRFGGFSPESEPETQALCDFCRKNDIRHALALHSQGEVVYWSWGENTPPRSRKMAEIMASVSGYALDVPVSLAAGGGFKDWFIEKLRRPAFTVELGRGENPLPDGSAGRIYADAREMLTLAAIM